MSRSKNYKAHIIPVPPTVTEDAEGNKTTGKVVYLKQSKKTEKREAAGFAQQGFYQVQLFLDASNPFESDPKPFTLNIFRNANPGWFDYIEKCLANKDMHKVLPLASHTAVLNDTIPGLVVEVPTGFEFYATVMDKTTGVEKKLESNQRDRITGDYNMKPVVKNRVKVFMFKSQVVEGDSDEAIKAFEESKLMVAQPEIDKAKDFPVNPAKVSTAGIIAQAEEKEETEKAA